MVEQIEKTRRQVSSLLDQDKRADLGQYFTPYPIAQFMASLFHDKGLSDIHLLDAGAGIGSLSIAFLEKFCKHSQRNIHVHAYELDPSVYPVLNKNLEDYAEGITGAAVHPLTKKGDFIREGVLTYLLNQFQTIDYAILNPPYRKINSDSSHRLLLRKVGIETVNLYAAFVALSILHLKKGGELVAIIPRSFCNGPYFRPFRTLLFEKTALQQIHIFDSRSQAFKEDSVLQENIIIHLIKDAKQGEVKISTSSGKTFDELKEFTIPFDRVVSPDDPEKFIHIPKGEQNLYDVAFKKFNQTLADLGITVSTGPVVDFRVKDFLHQEPTNQTAPLLHPAHFGDKNINWPKANFKKSNALGINEETKRQLFPTGHYTLVKRFSSKEEKRRIVARVVSPIDITGELIGFENHLNVFHISKKGLTEEIALGLAVYLNSSLIDNYFRQFNGHTQVNATDLRLITYPRKETLIELGNWIKNYKNFDQEIIDSKLLSYL